jgi:hypothetical protein
MVLLILIVVAPDQELVADLYKVNVEMTEQAGWKHYECSNYGKDGHFSRHNLHYWNGLDYIGIGPGAAGRLTLGGKRNSYKQVSSRDCIGDTMVFVVVPSALQQNSNTILGIISSNTYRYYILTDGLSMLKNTVMQCWNMSNFLLLNN